MSEENLKDINNLEKRINLLKAKPASKYNSSASSGERVISELFAGIIVGVFLGIWLDKLFNTKPILTIIFIILGLAGSIYNLYKASLKISNAEEKTTSDDINNQNN